ncbi:hypothetical protein PROFUN_09962 [Planoprotostelium fungivorum]|uniref:Uncharacterized protein n=1 Tax=Planoprotostelium fungivorum TaxID=1890364 RepID=A0A2P6NFF9_9EUKA|nr:hypothetical protein PROFUN_09962 [Planoprotostelium fungivorum]
MAWNRKQVLGLLVRYRREGQFDLSASTKHHRRRDCTICGVNLAEGAAVRYCLSCYEQNAVAETVSEPIIETSLVPNSSQAPTRQNRKRAEKTESEAPKAVAPTAARKTDPFPEVQSHREECCHVPMEHSQGHEPQRRTMHAVDDMSGREVHHLVIKDGQPCANHDRVPEGVVPQEYTLIKLKSLSAPRRAAPVSLSTVDLDGDSVEFSPSTPAQAVGFFCRQLQSRPISKDGLVTFDTRGVEAGLYQTRTWSRTRAEQPFRWIISSKSIRLEPAFSLAYKCINPASASSALAPSVRRFSDKLDSVMRSYGIAYSNVYIWSVGIANGRGATVLTPPAPHINEIRGTDQGAIDAIIAAKPNTPWSETTTPSTDRSVKGSIYRVNVSDSLSLPIIGDDPLQPSLPVVVSASGIPNGATFSTKGCEGKLCRCTSGGGDLQYGNVQWTPRQEDKGQYAMCFGAYQPGVT